MEPLLSLNVALGAFVTERGLTGLTPSCCPWWIISRPWKGSGRAGTTFTRGVPTIGYGFTNLTDPKGQCVLAIRAGSVLSDLSDLWEPFFWPAGFREGRACGHGQPDWA